MNNKDIFSVGLRFFGLLLLLETVRNIFLLILTITSPTSGAFGLLTLYSFFGGGIVIMKLIFYGISGYLFLTKADWIAGKFIQKKNKSTTSKETIVQIAVAYQGINAIIFSSISLIIALLKPIVVVLQPESIFYLFVYIIELTLGTWLLLRYDKIARFIVNKIPQKFWANS